MRGIGVLLLGFGVVVTWGVAHNYGACQQWWANQQGYACRFADTAHFWGIALLALGVVCFLGGMVLASRHKPPTGGT